MQLNFDRYLFLLTAVTTSLTSGLVRLEMTDGGADHLNTTKILAELCGQECGNIVVYSRGRDPTFCLSFALVRNLQQRETNE